MTDTPNVLKEKNTLSSKFSSLNSSNSKIKTHTSHFASHQNLTNHTPVNVRTKIQSGSSKVDSTKKKPASQIAKLAASTTTATSTPPKNSLQSILKPSSSSKTGFGVNPICKGVDYTEVMLRKSQFGYSGPGYIVEYDCDPKHLRGLRVEKGLWKVTTRATNKNTEAILGIGMNYIRIDEPENCTPLKQLTNYDFSYRPQNDFSSGLRKNLLTNFSIDDMNLESKHSKPKKCLRWAENLERIEERSQMITSNNNNESIEENHDSIVDNPVSPKPKRKLRKSLSMSDLNDILSPKIENDQENCQTLSTIDESVTNNFEINKENLNITYDKEEKKQSPLPISKVIHYVVHVSPNKVTNSSFLDAQIPANILQPNINLSISPVKTAEHQMEPCLSQQITSDRLKDFKEETDWEKKIDIFIDSIDECFFNEKQPTDEDDPNTKQSFIDFVNVENKYNLIVKFDKLEQRFRKLKMEIFKKTYNTN